MNKPNVLTELAIQQLVHKKLPNLRTLPEGYLLIKETSLLQLQFAGIEVSYQKINMPVWTNQQISMSGFLRQIRLIEKCKKEGESPTKYVPSWIITAYTDGSYKNYVEHPNNDRLICLEREQGPNEFFCLISMDSYKKIFNMVSDNKNAVTSVTVNPAGPFSGALKVTVGFSDTLTAYGTNPLSELSEA